VVCVILDGDLVRFLEVVIVLGRLGWLPGSGEGCIYLECMFLWPRLYSSVKGSAFGPAPFMIAHDYAPSTRGLAKNAKVNWPGELGGAGA